MKKKPKLKKFSTGGGYSEQTPDWNKAKEAMNDSSDNTGGNINYIQAGITGVNALTSIASTSNNKNLTNEQKQKGYANATNQAIDSVAGTVLPWYQYAQMGKRLAKSAIGNNPDDPTNRALNALATPQHEQMIDDISRGKYGDAAGDILGAGFYAPIKAYFNKDNTYKHGGKHKPKINFINPQPGNIMYGNGVDQYPDGGRLICRDDPSCMEKGKVIPKIQYDNYIKKAIADSTEGYNSIYNPDHIIGYDPYEVEQLMKKTETSPGHRNWNMYEAIMNTRNPSTIRTMYTPDEFPDGGISDTPNAEVEKEENTLNPDGSTNQYNGSSHENGGIPTQLYPGTLIFSDRLKLPGTKKTFADLNKKNNTDKVQKILDDENATSTAKSTAQLIKDLKNAKSLELFKAQEELKNFKISNYANKLGEEGVMYKDGGIHIKPSHKGRFTAYLKRTGSTLQEALHSKNPHVRQMANFARNAKHWKHANGGVQGLPKFEDGAIYPTPDGQPIQPEYSNSWLENPALFDPNYDQNSYVKSIPQVTTPESTSRIDNFYGTNPTYTSGPNISQPDVKKETTADEDFDKIMNNKIMKAYSYLPSQQPGYKPKTKQVPNFWDKNGQYMKDASAGITQAAPYLWSLNNNKFGKKYDTTTPYLTTPHLLSDRETLKDSESAYKTALYNSKQLGGPGTLAAMNNAYANKVMNDAKIREYFANQNAGILNQTDEFNIGQKNLARDLNMKSKARSEDQARLDMQGLSNTAANVNKDYNTNVQQENMIKYISSMYPDFTFDRRRGWFYNSKGEELKLKQ